MKLQSSHEHEVARKLCISQAASGFNCGPIDMSMMRLISTLSLLDADTLAGSREGE